jgi:hypothetical protein
MSNKTIDVETLRDWLDSGRPVTVLDVRSAAQTCRWRDSRQPPRRRVRVIR